MGIVVFTAICQAQLMEKMSFLRDKSEIIKNDASNINL